jgi:hypothetical protein
VKRGGTSGGLARFCVVEHTATLTLLVEIQQDCERLQIRRGRRGAANKLWTAVLPHGYGLSMVGPPIRCERGPHVG